jgi:DNA replication protein DnaC
MPIGQHAADLLFQALSERHERGSVIVNTNLPNAQVLEMNGESYRLKSARRRRKAGK